MLTIEAKPLELEVSSEIVALSLFISDPELPWYFDDPTSDLKVISLTSADLQAGPPSAPQGAARLSPELLRFEEAQPQDVSFVGGIAKYIQQDRPTQPEPGFVLQCSAYDLRVNLGDSGVLFMFTTWPMWESC